MKKNFRVVNNITPSVDGKGLMQGRYAYTDDLAPQGSLVVKLLRSPHAFARIKSIDISAAEKVPGVACILTKDNVPMLAASSPTCRNLRISSGQCPSTTGRPMLEL